MDTAIKVLALLPWTDWAAVAAFFVGWIGYAVFAKRRSTLQPSLLDTTNRIRRQWMLQSTYREVRVVDGIVIQNLSTSPSFFASTTILIIGGLLAVLGTTEKASELVREIPFAARTSVLVFDLKVVLLLGIFVYAFFRFTWSHAAVHLRRAAGGARCPSATTSSRWAPRATRCASRSPTAPGASLAWRPRPSTTACAPTTSPSRRSAGSSRRWCSAGHGGRRLHPVPARVPLRGAGRAEGLKQ